MYIIEMQNLIAERMLSSESGLAPGSQWYWLVDTTLPCLLIESLLALDVT
jgi:hypothetical protein